jgi:hypothetical protein
MQRDPGLTMDQIKHLLMAGASGVSGRSLEGAVGTGQLDIVGALLAQDAAQVSATFVAASGTTHVDPERSRLAWSDSFARPAPEMPLVGYLVLRDELDQPLVVVPEELTVSLDGPGQVQWEVTAPGLVRLEINADSGSGGDNLDLNIQLQGRTIYDDTVDIALDAQLASFGYSLWGASCMTKCPGKSPTGSHLWLFLTFALLLVLRRRKAQPSPVILK